MKAYKEGKETLIGEDEAALTKCLVAHRIRRHLPRATAEEAEADVQAKAFDFNPRSPSKPKLFARMAKNAMTLRKLWSGSRAYFDILKGDVAPDALIVERANICAKCPHIMATETNCTTCAKNNIIKLAHSLAVKIGRNFINPRITTHYKKTDRLSNFYCEHCGCSCLALCLSKSKHFLKLEDKERPANCWANPKNHGNI